jgi:5-methylcytosine-specific restriction endonuclease McrA
LIVLKSCPQCGSEFKTYRTAAIFCGKDCQNRSQLKRDTYTCAHCSKQFQRPAGVIKKDAVLRYCNRACHAAARKAASLRVTCPACGKEHQPMNTKVRYCSRECRNRGLVTATYETCHGCGQLYRRFASKVERRYCSDKCYRYYSVGAEHPNWRGGKWLKHGRRWQEIRAAIIERDGRCLWCSAESSPGGKALHVHHLDARRNYSIVDLANHPENLVTLCSSCHTRVEMAVTHGRAAELPTHLRPPA